jgi:hypothetical protein
MMLPDLWKEAGEKLKALGGGLPAYTAVGSFLFYLVGYLVLRFQLSAWGVATDLPALDERYFFAGARFVVYVVASVPNVVLLALPLAALHWLLRRLLRLSLPPDRGWLVVAGIVFSVLMVQLVMRQCFFFVDNFLLREKLAGPEWLKAVLLDDSGILVSHYFSGLVAGVAVTTWFLTAARRSQTRRPWAEALLAFLLGVQALLLPVNYSILVASKNLPKVNSFAPKQAWLVWEGKESVTFLVDGDTRLLVALPRSEAKRIEISGSENVLRRFHGGQKQ